MTEYRSMIEHALQETAKDELISELRRQSESMSFSNNIIHVPALKDETFPDKIIVHLFQDKNQWRLGISGKNLNTRLRPLVFRRFFKQNEFGKILEWYEKCMKKLLTDYDELRKFRNRHEDVKISQKGISRYLFEVGNSELWFGRFVVYKKANFPWQTHICSAGSNHYSVNEYKTSFGLINTFLKGAETLSKDMFPLLPCSLRDSLVGELK